MEHKRQGWHLYFTWWQWVHFLMGHLLEIGGFCTLFRVLHLDVVLIVCVTPVVAYNFLSSPHLVSSGIIWFYGTSTCWWCLKWVCWHGCVCICQNSTSKSVPHTTKYVSWDKLLATNTSSSHVHTCVITFCYKEKKNIAERKFMNGGKS